MYNIDMNNIHVPVDFPAQVSSEKSQWPSWDWPLSVISRYSVAKLCIFLLSFFKCENFPNINMSSHYRAIYSVYTLLMRLISGLRGQNLSIFCLGLFI